VEGCLIFRHNWFVLFDYKFPAIDGTAYVDEAFTGLEAFPVVGDPIDYGWKLYIGQYKHIIKTNQPAITAILELTKCGCKRGCHS
jgi:hypothetical protein